MILSFVVVSLVSVVSVVSKKPYQARDPNFLSEGVRLGLDKEIAPDGTYLAYFPFGAMIERSRMAPYHKKLLEVHLIDKRLCLWLMTAEVYVEGHRVLVTALLKKLVAELI